MKRTFELKPFTWTALPYIYFIGLAAFWFLGDIFAGKNFSYVALGIIMVLIIQAVKRNKVVGVALGIFAIAVNSLFFLAVLSEFRDFEVVSQSAIQLLTIGSVLSLSGLAMGVLMASTNANELA